LDPEKWERFGVETGESACRAARESLGNDRVSGGTLTDARWPEGAFDVITFWSALEHMNHPRASLVEARRIIKTGGSLIVQVPNAGSYQARWFTADWFALDAPRHRYHFDLPILNRLLADSGFKVNRTSYFSKAHNAHALKQSLKLKFNSEGSSIFARACFYLALPLIKPFDYAMSALGQGATLTVCARAV
jgi:ubiquinone/menaquinone biosynthesis C-methylase UbiE